MRLINVEVFLERERLFLEREKLYRRRKRIDRHAEVLEFCDDEVTEYAILSHRWTDGQEVDYNEITELAKMAKKERSEIRNRDGYQKILQSCEQAKRDGYKWLWVDTCCIDKRSSSELSEAINSMYRWYENSRICYAYLHDVDGSSLSTSEGNRPQWFSRGWTLQEMIAPRDVQFFNKDWHPIGDKRTLSPILEDITQVPQHILKEGLSSNRPCVAQIMSWATNRKTTRVEDRAYSLMGLLDVNMPMLYGEGKKAFHRLQLEIIRTSNDQSIFAWGCNGIEVRTGSILADEPSFFRDCNKMELMSQDEFIESIRRENPEEEELSIADDRLGTFPITNRGIQIWLLLLPHGEFDTVFQALLPCRSRPSGPPVVINLALWESNYYRYPGSLHHNTWCPPQLRQVYLRYQGMPHCNSKFEIDDSAIPEKGFTSSVTFPEGLIPGNMVTLSTTDPLCVKRYSCSQEHHFAVGFGQCFGQNWIRVACEEADIPSLNIQPYYGLILDRVPEHAQSMKKARSGAGRSRVYILQTRLPRSTWILQTSCVMWKGSSICGVKLEVFQNPGLGNVSSEWIGFAVDGTDDTNHDWRGLMICHFPTNQDGCELLMDGVSTIFSHTPKVIELGDYGHFTDSEDFCCEGNLFTEIKSQSLKVDVTPRQHRISKWGGRQRESDVVRAYHFSGDLTELYAPLGLSLPSNGSFNSSLVFFSTRLTNKYLITRVIRSGSDTTHLYNIAKPFVWHRNEGVGSVVGGAVMSDAGSPNES